MQVTGPRLGQTCFKLPAPCIPSSFRELLLVVVTWNQVESQGACESITAFGSPVVPDVYLCVGTLRGEEFDESLVRFRLSLRQ